MPKGYPKGFTSGYHPRVNDPPELVVRVKALYGAGWSQMEIASLNGWTLKRVQGIFKRNGIKPRRQVIRNQTGPRNANWKGADAGYQAKHLRVYRARGKPTTCSVCGTDDPTKTYDWASLTGNYQDIEDFAPMCRSCHRRYDKGVQNLRR